MDTKEKDTLQRLGLGGQQTAPPEDKATLERLGLLHPPAKQDVATLQRLGLLPEGK